MIVWSRRDSNGLFTEVARLAEQSSDVAISANAAEWPCSGEMSSAACVKCHTVWRRLEGKNGEQGLTQLALHCKHCLSKAKFVACHMLASFVHVHCRSRSPSKLLGMFNMPHVKGWGPINKSLRESTSPRDQVGLDVQHCSYQLMVTDK